MAKIIENEKEFKVIELSQREARKLGFGILEGCVCMNCNDIIQEPIYFICVLNDVMCKKCYEEWYQDAEHYREDYRIENQLFEYYKKKCEQIDIDIHC